MNRFVKHRMFFGALMLGASFGAGCLIEYMIERQPEGQGRAEDGQIPVHSGRRRDAIERSFRKESRLRTLLGGKDVEEIIMLVEGLKNRPLAGGNYASIDILIARAAKIDPKRTLEYLMEADSENLRRFGLPTLLNVWLSDNMKQAIQVVASLPRNQLKREIELRMVHAMAEQQPGLAYEIIKKNNLGSDDVNTLMPIYRTFLNWGESDWDAAVAKLQEIDGEETRADAIAGLAKAKSRHNLDEAFLWASRDLNDMREAGVGISIVLREGFAVNPENTFELMASQLKSMESGITKQLILSNLNQMVDYDINKTMTLIIERFGDSEAARELILSSMEILSTAKPKESIDVILRAYPDFSRGEGGSEIANVFLRALEQSGEPDPLAWLASHGLTQNAALFQMAFDHLSSRSPSEAANLALKMQAGDLTCKLLESAIGNWAVGDLDAATSWIDQNITNSTLAIELKSKVELRGAEVNPELYAENSVHREDSPSNRKLINTIALQWSSKDPASAALWADRIENEILSGLAIKNIASQWLKQDSIGASNWISQMPAGHVRDSLVVTLVREIEKSDPASAEKWKATLIKTK